MDLLTLMMIAVALSVDAFAASLSCGSTMTDFKHNHCLLTAFLFGLFQGLMPLMGWVATGFLQGEWVEPLNHWIAFILLSIIGLKMVWESFHPNGECKNPNDVFHIRNLLILAVATSIDALAVGISFSLLDYSIIREATLIAITTFIISYIGVRAGHKLSHIFGERMESVGGAVLILIGLKILLLG
ncbi:MAG: hypothetical protein B6241_07905 [Spirochaetaceae bacterium 4572_59]|nr:MAG: hypothetical protein B6241_07905 [Spirochaetaceae bacterium 4572_59]